MNWFQSRTILTPWECMVPDFDVQAQVEAIYKEMEVTLPTKWVKGHQGMNKKKSKLKWEEQLNVCADELANQA
eukprot:15366524-Ditylum_brightwellii.AAC.1